MSFTLDEMKLHLYSIPLKYPFRISAGMISEKKALLVELRCGDVTGWGEAAVDEVPFYASETVGGVVDMLRKSLWPLLKGVTFNHPDEVTDRMDYFRGNHYAKAAVDAAVWDVYGKMLGKPVWQLIGGVREKIETAPTVGIMASPEEALAECDRYLALGDCRIKLKVKPGFDDKYISLIRKHYPDVRVMVDANSAYRFEDADKLKAWDEYSLMMVEQPLNETDIYFHSLLRKKINSPICLDESMHYLHDVECCGKMGAADIVNIKVCRAGGITNSRRMHDICASYGIANWVGGRFGFSVSVAPRAAVATLPNCSMPTDCVMDLDYMIDDIVEEPFTAEKYWSKSPVGPGLGFKVIRKKLEKYTDSVIEL